MHVVMIFNAGRPGSILRTSEYIYIYIYSASGIAQLVQRFVTGWTVRISNPGGGTRFSVGTVAHPNPFKMDTGYFLAVKRPEPCADHQSTSSAMLRMGWRSYTSTSILCLHSKFMRWPLPLCIHVCIFVCVYSNIYIYIYCKLRNIKPGLPVLKNITCIWYDVWHIMHNIDESTG